MTLGHPHRHYRACESTNDVAKQLAAGGSPHGTVITADEQTAGRGRQGRSWVAPAGTALLMSAIARPVTARRKLTPLAAALAVAETCELLGSDEAAIKWPNDVWIDGRKVAGIGLNTSVRLEDMPAELRDTATTLGLDPGVDALAPLLEGLTRWLGATPDEVVAAWRGRDALLGRRIAWADGAGVAEGIDEHGNLVVALDDGSTTELAAGEVHLAVEV